MSSMEPILQFYVDTLGSHIVHQVVDDRDDDGSDGAAILPSLMCSQTFC